MVPLSSAVKKLLVKRFNKAVAVRLQNEFFFDQDAAIHVASVRSDRHW
jgi:hypothetical protein